MAARAAARDAINGTVTSSAFVGSFTAAGSSHFKESKKQIEQDAKEIV